MTNSLKLQLENFQSITSGELEFVTGLNFIIGQSNSGKSATFRALKTCLYNPTGSQRFIKRGYPKSAVTLSYNGNVITWKRTAKESSYTINGEDYVKTGSSSAFKILKDETGFIQGDNGVIMNIEEELQLPFPFGYNKSELFKLYENVFCVSDSAVIMKSAKEHENKVKFDLDMLNVELEKNKTKLQELEAFKKEIDLNELKRRLADCKKLNDRLTLLKDGTDVIQLAVKASKVQVDITPISTENKIPAYKELINLKSLISKVKQYHELSKNLPVPISVSSEKLESLREQRELKELAARLTELSQIKVEEKVFENKLSDFQEKVELKKTFLQLKELHEIKIKSIEFEDKLAKYKELIQYKAGLKALSDKISLTQAELTYVENNLSNLQGKLKEYKVCPLCHRPLED